MNKQGWEIKKLGDICKVLDSKRRPITKKDRVSGIYPYYGATGIQDYIDNYIFDGLFVLVGEDGAKWGANDKTSFLVTGKCWVNNHAHVLEINKTTSPQWVIYYLNHKDLNEYITGAVVPKLNQQALRNILIPIPPLPIQNQIVKELDTLQAIITKKKAQLEELDKLAQATFYDMFGDPVENEKGWIKKKLFELTSKLGDGIHGTPRYTDNGDYFFINGNNLKDGKVIITTATKKVSKEEYERHKTDLTKNTILISINGTIGNIAFYNQEKIMLGKSVCYLNLNNDIGIIYIYSLLKTNYFLEYAKGESTGSTIKNVSLKTMRNFNIPIPPLPLQNQFAKQIEAIEKQKELINQSIAETQLLFDSAMDNYFN